MTSETCFDLCLLCLNSSKLYLSVTEAEQNKKNVPLQVASFFFKHICFNELAIFHVRSLCVAASDMAQMPTSAQTKLMYFI